MSVADMNSSFNNSAPGDSSAGGKMPAPHTGPHSPGGFRPGGTSPAHLKPQPLHGGGGSGQGKRNNKNSGGSGSAFPALEGTSLTVTVNQENGGGGVDTFRPGSSSSNRGRPGSRPGSSSNSNLGNTVGVLSQQVNQLAISVARIEMRLNGGFGAYGAPRDFSNSNRIGSAPVPGQMQPKDGIGMGGVGVAGGMGGINAAYCLSCDNPVNNMSKTGVSSSSYAMQQQGGGDMGGQGGGFHFPQTTTQPGGSGQRVGQGGIEQRDNAGYVSLPSVPDAVINQSQGGGGVAMTGYAMMNQSSGGTGTVAMNRNQGIGSSNGMPPNPNMQGQRGGITQSNNQPNTSTGSLPLIDRGTYYPPAREVSAEMMGVKGADGRVYRSDVPKSGDRANSRTKGVKSKHKDSTVDNAPRPQN